MRKVEKLLRLCERCANPFQIYPSFKHAARFCSVACRSETAAAKLIRIGWTIPPRGESHGASKLTIPDIRLIREIPAGPNVTRELAERFSVSRATICNVRSRKVWAHVA